MGDPREWLPQSALVRAEQGPEAKEGVEERVGAAF